MKSRLHKLVAPSDIRADGEGGSFEGYGSVFGVEDSYSEVVAPGAFEESLADHKAKGTLPAMLWQHDSDRPIGVYRDMREDKHGLFIKGDILLDIDDGKRAHSLLKAKALSGLSIGFMPQKWEDDSETRIRTLTKVDLWEVSVVTFPANPESTITAVKAAEFTTIREIEHALRDAGFSRSEAVALMRRHLEIAGSEREAAAAMSTLSASADRLLALTKSA